MKKIILFLLIIAPLASKGQLKKKDLIGRWIVSDSDSLYFKKDTVLLIEDINYKIYSSQIHTQYIYWNIQSSNKICIESENVNVFKISPKYQFKIYNSRKELFFLIKDKGKILDSFYVISFEIIRVERYPYEIRKMVLKRVGT